MHHPADSALFRATLRINVRNLQAFRFGKCREGMRQVCTASEDYMPVAENDAFWIYKVFHAKRARLHFEERV